MLEFLVWVWLMTGPTPKPTRSPDIRHLAASTAAGYAFRVDPALLLAIAWRESGFNPNARFREHHGGTSCGVMQVTPWPIRSCSADEHTILGGYVAGARRLHQWLAACRGNLPCALTGYAGGYMLLRTCRVRRLAACAIPADFQQRAVQLRAHTRS